MAFSSSPPPSSSSSTSITTVPPVSEIVRNSPFLYPKTYVAPKTSDRLVIDGDLTKPAWDAAPWSDAFDDIRGPNDVPSPDDRPDQSCQTKVKMMWDDEFLYIGALMTSDMTTVATFTERNSPIFQKDSDFEVFLDPLGSCHDYKEYEVNGLGTYWNLMLDKPYIDGGVEHSGRIAQPGDEDYYDVKNQRTATQVLDGKLNDPDGHGATWSVEIAMSHKDILSHIMTPTPPIGGSGSATTSTTDNDGEGTTDQAAGATGGLPTAGTRWRINFSRVEKRGEINWTWQPQIAWDPSSRRYRGWVNMHLPDAWGYLYFADDNDDTDKNVRPDPYFPPRLAAMNLYYALHAYKRQTGAYTYDLHQLLHLVDEGVTGHFRIGIKPRRATPHGMQGTEADDDDDDDDDDGFVVTIQDASDESFVVTVNDERLLMVVPSNQSQQRRNKR